LAIFPGASANFPRGLFHSPSFNHRRARVAIIFSPSSLPLQCCSISASFLLSHKFPRFFFLVFFPTAVSFYVFFLLSQLIRFSDSAHPPGSLDFSTPRSLLSHIVRSPSSTTATVPLHWTQLLIFVFLTPPRLTYPPTLRFLSIPTSAVSVEGVHTRLRLP